MYSTHEAELDLPNLPLSARHVHIVPALQAGSLLSMGQLCDAGCVVTFDATTVRVHRNSELLLLGTRTPTTGLWHLNIAAADPPIHHQSFSTVASATPADLVAFAHAALFSPALSTLKRALDLGFQPHFMGLTAKSLATHPPTSVAMIKGHMDQARKNQHSTKKPSPVLPDPPPDDAFPFSDTSNVHTHHCFAALVEPRSEEHTS